MLTRKVNNTCVLVFAILIMGRSVSTAQTDTLRVMTYNVLYYGNGCQGPNYKYHEYLRTITAFANPDLFSMVKMASIPVSKDDKSGTAPYGFADSILQFALNAAYPGRYAYCPFTNAAKANNVAVLFYDQRKVGFAAMVSSYSNITDFNTYKMYYKDPNLAQTHDTVFLYLTLNHDKSGKENEEVRSIQIGEEMKYVKAHFTELPNYINLGDFNVRSSNERFYKELTANPDPKFRLYDPPFFPDQSLAYPANWEHEGKYAAYFTTSARESETVPNSCGSGGGGKDWYDHIFISPWLVENRNHMRYIPHSYRTIGNDGQRFKVAINNKNAHVNTSAPADVIESMYQFSNKYPVMIALEVNTKTKVASPANPEIAGVPVIVKEEVKIVLNNQKDKKGKGFAVLFPDAMMGQEIHIECFDKDSKSVIKKKFTLKDNEQIFGEQLGAGSYRVQVSGKHNLIAEATVTLP